MTEPLRFVRSPDSVLDYTIDWSDWLGVGDVITESTWTAAEESGLTVVTSSISDTTTTVWLSGGVGGTGLVDGFYPFTAKASYYHMINTVTTAGGRTDERTLVLLTKEL